MKKETGNWNDSAVNRPEASGSAGASTAGVDSLRSPGSFSSNSSDADQVGAQHFLLLSIFFSVFSGGSDWNRKQKKVLEFVSQGERKNSPDEFFGHHFWGQNVLEKSKRERPWKPEVDLRLGLFFYYNIPFFFIIIVCVWAPVCFFVRDKTFVNCKKKIFRPWLARWPKIFWMSNCAPTR